MTNWSEPGGQTARAPAPDPVVKRDQRYIYIYKDIYIYIYIERERERETCHMEERMKKSSTKTDPKGSRPPTAMAAAGCRKRGCAGICPF